MKTDNLAWSILKELQSDARISLKALASRIGLSLPATSERVKRLEEGDIIQGYSADVNVQALGYSVITMVGMTTA